MNKIRIGVVGIGNCASSLIQGLYYYADNKTADCIGVMHQVIDKYKVSDIEVVVAFDVDTRKVGLDVSEAIFAKPNCTKVFHGNVPKMGVKVRMGKVLDGVSEQMIEYQDKGKTFVLSETKEPSEDEIVNLLKNSKTDVLLNYLPVGSEEATKFYANCALKAGVAFVNNIPVFIASDPDWEKRFKEKNIPIIGDDIKAQVGAGIGMPNISQALRKCKGRLFPFGWYHILKALKSKTITDFDLLLIAVRPDYQNKGVNAIFFHDQIKYFIKYGVQYAETTSIQESNVKNQANWEYFEHTLHKRRRAYIKRL